MRWRSRPSAGRPAFAGFLIPLFAWLARQESIRKGKAVKLGMEKARAEGRNVGRPEVFYDLAGHPAGEMPAP